MCKKLFCVLGNACLPTQLLKCFDAKQGSTSFHQLRNASNVIWSEIRKHNLTVTNECVDGGGYLFTQTGSPDDMLFVNAELKL